MNSFPYFLWNQQTHCFHATSVQCRDAAAYQAANPSQSRCANHKIPVELARLLFFPSIKKTFSSFIHTCSGHHMYLEGLQGSATGGVAMCSSRPIIISHRDCCSSL